jgi:lipopolysaccharide export system protein LptA
MMVKKIWVILFHVLILVPHLVWGQTTIDQRSVLRKNEPIEIVADRMEAIQEKRVVVFSGNAEATQGDIKLKTDRLSIFYKESDAKKDKKENQSIQTTGQMDRIEAKGNVKITHKQMSATGDEAVYYQETAQIIMSGNPVLHDGSNTIKGCRIVIYIQENRGKVEQCGTGSSGRVTATIHPQGKK